MSSDQPGLRRGFGLQTSAASVIHGRAVWGWEHLGGPASSQNSFSSWPTAKTAIAPCGHLLIVSAVKKRLWRMDWAMEVRAPVLIVDDDVYIVELVEMTLGEEGYVVEAARDEIEALEKLKEIRPCLILLDMRMPEMNGWEFSQAYRSAPGPHAPIIVITAGKDAPGKAEEIGAQGYLSKPFDLDELITVVKRVVSYTPGSG